MATELSKDVAEHLQSGEIIRSTLNGYLIRVAILLPNSSDDNRETLKDISAVCTKILEMDDSHIIILSAVHRESKRFDEVDDGPAFG